MRFNYAVLMYVHDILAQEFVNVGLVVYSGSYLIFEYTRKTDRLLAMFPDMNIDLFQSNLLAIEQTISPVIAEAHYDGSYVFGLNGGGIVDDLDKEFDRLYTRLIERS